MKIILFFLVAVTSLVLGTSFHESFSEEFENTYTNEKCGISINYPKDWEAENNDISSGNLKRVANIIPEGEDIFSVDIPIKLLDISDYRDKSIEYVSEVFRPSEDELETIVIQDDIIQLVGFPAQNLVYIEGKPGEYEFREDKDHVMKLNILAYDKVYELELRAENQEKFDEYSSIVEEMVNTIKITKPNFEGINC